MKTKLKIKSKPNTWATTLLFTTPACGLLNAQSDDSRVAYKLDSVVLTGEPAQISQAYTPLKSGADLIDTPASLSIAIEELVDSQGAVSLQDSIRNISGLTHAGNNYGIGDQLSLRGQDVSYTYDGLHAGLGGSGGGSGATVRSLTNVDRVEVLKGAAGTLYGIGDAGGIINLVEKRPQSTEQRKVFASIGSWDTYNAELDFTGPINEDWSYRLILATRESEGYRDFSEDRTELYPSFQYNPGDKHTLLISGAYIDDSVQVDSVGHPVRIYDDRSVTPEGIAAGDLTLDNIPNGPEGGNRVQLTDAQKQQLIDSLAPGEGTEPYDLGGSSLISPLARPNDGEEYRLKFRHDWQIDENTTLSHYAQYLSYSSEYVRHTGAFNYVYWNRRDSINAAPRSPLVENGVLYPFAVRRQEYRRFAFEEDSLQYFAEGKRRFEVGDSKHELLLTAYGEWRDYEAQSASLYDADNSRSSANPVPYIYDMRNPNWPAGSFEDYAFSVRSDYTKDVQTIGAGIQDVVSLPNDITLRAAIGWNQVDQGYDNNIEGSDGNPLPLASKDEGITYNLGANWRFQPQSSFYVNAAKGRTALSVIGSVSLDNQPPDSESENFEIGFRKQMLDGRFMFSTALFTTSKTNLRYSNPDYDDNPSSPTYNVSVDPYRYDGEEKSEGIETDLNLNLKRDWLVNFNATYQDAKTKSNPGEGTITLQKKGVPRFFSSVWVYRTLSNEFMGGKLSIGGGVRHTSQRSISSSSFGIINAWIPSFTTTDAVISYERDESWNVQLNLNNLTDEDYYEFGQFLGGRPGEPFNATLKFATSF